LCFKKDGTSYRFRNIFTLDDKIVYSEGIKSENYDKEALLGDKVIILANFVLIHFLSHLDQDKKAIENKI